MDSDPRDVVLLRLEIASVKSRLQSECQAIEDLRVEINKHDECAAGLRLLLRKLRQRLEQALEEA